VPANWLRAGLRAERVCLTPDQLREYLSATRAFLEEYRPIRIFEIQVVQCIIDTSWRANVAAQVLQVSDNGETRVLAAHERYLRSKLRRLRLDAVRLYLDQPRARRYKVPFELSNSYLCYQELLDLTDRLSEAPTPKGDCGSNINSMESVIYKFPCFAKIGFAARQRAAKQLASQSEFRFEKSLVRSGHRRGAETPTSPQPSL
jgi:hypothetical protein